MCSNREPAWGCDKHPGPHCAADGGCPVPLGGMLGAKSIGTMIREEGFGGAFIFEVDYDAVGANSLVSWLGKGMRGD